MEKSFDAYDPKPFTELTEGEWATVNEELSKVGRTQYMFNYFMKNSLIAKCIKN